MNRWMKKLKIKIKEMKWKKECKKGNKTNNNSNYILDQAGKGNNKDKRPIPIKLKDDRFWDMGKRADDDNRSTSGKLKYIFD